MPARVPQGRSIRGNKSSSSSDYSDGSDYSLSTAPTVHSVRPSIQQYTTSGNPYEKDGWGVPEYPDLDYAEPRASTETYTSSTSSFEDQDLDLDQDQELPSFDTLADGFESGAPKALASTPQEFAEYFPSTQRLCIRHDDSTMDGNMNLRVDTEARTYNGGDVDLTLFHLRMHDLKRREFSLRRYCRDSGREICSSSRKYSKPSVMKRPALQRSWSNALSGLRSKSDTKAPTMTGLKRHDSGYDSMPENGADRHEEPSLRETVGIPMPTNTTRLEFSNYAHIEVKRRGAKTSKKYEFEYWGGRYAWRRIVVASGNFRETSYHLYNVKTSDSLAHIVPIPQSSSERREEEAKGGWVPPCAMMLEESVVAEGSTDLADVIVASGLIALVDDCIKSRWHQKSRVQMSVPMMSKTPLKMNMEYVGPKRLIDEVFHRRDTTSTRPSTPVSQIKT